MGDGELQGSALGTGGVGDFILPGWELGVDMLGDVIKHFFAKLCSWRDT